jgi:CRP-like cAMP-binding protein
MKHLDIAIHHITRIIDLTKEEKQLFSQLVDVIEVKRHENLLAIGQICKYEYFVLEGCLRSYYLDKELNENTIMFAIEGFWTGELYSFHKNVPSAFAIVAVEDTSVFRISKIKLEQLYQSIPKFERYFRILLQNRLIAIETATTSTALGATEAYQHFLKTFRHIEQRVPLKHIASYLGITPTYLSRIRKKQFLKKK